MTLAQLVAPFVLLAGIDVPAGGDATVVLPALPANTTVRLWGNPAKIEADQRSKADAIPTEIVIKEEALDRLPHGLQSLIPLESLDARRIASAGLKRDDAAQVELMVTLLPATKSRAVRFSVQPYVSYKKRIGRAWTTDFEIWILKNGRLYLERASENWAVLAL